MQTPPKSISGLVRMLITVVWLWSLSQRRELGSSSLEVLYFAVSGLKKKAEPSGRYARGHTGDGCESSGKSFIPRKLRFSVGRSGLTGDFLHNYI
jgi:hypothetical protein